MSFEKLVVWQKSHLLVLAIYEATKDFPNDEKFGVVSQIRRAAVSIAANIAEGSKRKTDKDKANFVNMSEASLEEVKYLLRLSLDLKFIDENKCRVVKADADEVGRLLNGFYKKLKSGD